MEHSAPVGCVTKSVRPFGSSEHLAGYDQASHGADHSGDFPRGAGFEWPASLQRLRERRALEVVVHRGEHRAEDEPGDGTTHQSGEPHNERLYALAGDVDKDGQVAGYAA